MSLRKTAALCIALVSGSALPVHSQTWVAIGDLVTGGQFWNNPSSDGATCHAGYIVTGNSGAGCGSQRPAGWLPYTGAVPTTFLQAADGGPQGFAFLPGTWTFSLLEGTVPGGDVAGLNAAWGWYDLDTGNYADVNAAFPTSPLTFTGNWVLQIDLAGGTAWSDDAANNQFASFGYNTPGTAAGFGDDGYEWIIGIEDIFTGPGGGSDKDFQDIMFRLQWDGGGTPQEVVPEPATMTLLATGLAGMAAARRRRKR